MALRISDDPWRFCDEQGVLLADGFDDAFLGVAQRFGWLETVACYDYLRCLEILVEAGATHEEAEEYFTYNTLGAWVGPRTPVFVVGLRLDDIRKMEKECVH